MGVDPAKTTADWLAKAAAKDYAYLLNEHYADYSELFNRVRLNINNVTVETADLPVNRRLEAYRQGKPDYYLEQLYYQFGRYLLISSSRADNMISSLESGDVKPKILPETDVVQPRVPKYDLAVTRPGLTSVRMKLKSGNSHSGSPVGQASQ